MVATKYGHTAIAKLLLKNNAKIDLLDKDGKTNLVWTSPFGYAGIVELLKSYSKKQDFESLDNQGAQQSSSSSLPSTSTLSSSSSSPSTSAQISSSVPPQQTESAFAKELDATIWAYLEKPSENRDQLLKLLRSSKMSPKQLIESIINTQGKGGWTALMWASRWGHLAMVEQLIKSRARIDLRNEDGDTALMCASLQEHDAIVKLLLKSNAQVNLQNEDGDTALMCASLQEHNAIVELLLQNNAQVNLQNKNGDTALMCASHNEQNAIVELLLKNNAEMNLPNKNGDTVLMTASRYGYTDIVELLLKNRANVDIKNEKGETALIQASDRKNANIVALLLSCGANTKIQNLDGKTAFDIALIGCLQIAEILAVWDDATKNKKQKIKAVVELLDESVRKKFWASESWVTNVILDSAQGMPKEVAQIIMDYDGELLFKLLCRALEP